MNKTKICSNKKSLAFLFFYATLGFSVSSITSSCGSENNLQKQAGNEESNFLKKIEEFNKNITTLQTKLNNSELKGAMQTKVENLSDSIKKFQDKLESNQSKDSLQQEIESLCKEIKDLQGELDSKLPGTGDEQTAKEALNAAITSLKGKLNSIKIEEDDLMINNLCQDMDDLQSRLNNEKPKEEMQIKIDKLRASIKNLQNKLESNQSKDGLQQDIESLCKEIKDLKDEIDSNQPESDNTAINVLCEDIKNFQDAFNKSKEQLIKINILKQKIKSIDSSLEKLEQLNNLLNSNAFYEFIWIRKFDDYNKTSTADKKQDFLILNMKEIFQIFDEFLKNYKETLTHDENTVYNPNSIKKTLYNAFLKKCDAILKNDDGTVNSNKGIIVCYNRQLFCNGKKNEPMEVTCVHHGTLMSDSNADKFTNGAEKLISNFVDDFIKHE